MEEQTPEIKHIFQTAKRLADGLAQLLGRNAEVVIHDFSDLSHSLVYVAGSVTNRQVGAPITDLAYKKIKERGDDVEDMHGYKTVSRNGRILKSSTMFLRTSTGRVVGCLCVNFDITEFLNAKSLLDDLTGFDDSGEDMREERFASSFNETMGSLIDEAVAQAGKQPATMDKEERLSLLRVLEEQEVFLFKGAVNQVARVFGVSRYTIYNYLKEIRSGENDI
ncbi:helix-turn-helix transcriptional regulator [Pseudodesulfovibrio tunisiensis]|uniref:helix-turn-helix transcriptional regulator n=1 Tax=Pseudodesulfovibrio tunisiensis TaxID=463192 RepID=UPI001FB3360F|nr:PAS domain-containing protein [Pseudodesulfovibrio tunisiensis]